MADIKGNVPKTLVKQKMLQREMQLKMTLMQSETRLMELDFEKEKVLASRETVEEELEKLQQDIQNFDKSE